MNNTKYNIFQAKTRADKCQKGREIKRKEKNKLKKISGEEENKVSFA